MKTILSFLILLALTSCAVTGSIFPPKIGVEITASKTRMNDGTIVTVVAFNKNTFASHKFYWKINDMIIPGENNNTMVMAPNNGEKVICYMTINGRDYESNAIKFHVKDRQ